MDVLLALFFGFAAGLLGGFFFGGQRGYSMGQDDANEALELRENGRGRHEAWKAAERQLERTGGLSRGPGRFSPRK